MVVFMLTVTFLEPFNIGMGLQAGFMVFLRLSFIQSLLSKLWLYRLAKEDNMNNDVRNGNIGKVK